MRLFTLACCIAATLSLSRPVAAQEDPPAPDVAMRAFKAVEGWVRGWKVPETGGEPCAAASVILRMDGQVMGKGMAVAAAEKDRAVLLLWAARQAVLEAEPKLGVPRDALYDETLRDVAKRLTISVQLAGGLIPITPKDAAEAAVEVAPGLEGVGARLGDRIAVNFPERMLIAQAEPGPALASLAAKLGDDPALAVVPLARLAKEHGVVFYRFKVAHLAQSKAGEPAVFLERCARPIAQGAIDSTELKRWADSLAHILIGEFRDNGPQRGSRDPFAGKIDSATPSQTLTCALAMAFYSRLYCAEEFPRREAGYRSTTLAQCAAGLDEPDPAEQALFLIWRSQKLPLTNSTAEGAEPLPLIRRLGNAREFVDKWRDSFVRGEIDEPAASLGLLAAASVDCQQAPSSDGGAIRKAVASIPATQLPAAMPWLGWGDLQLHPKETVPSVDSLRLMRAQLWAHQLQPDNLPPDQQDLAGGIVFSTSKNPMPTWQMARPLAFIATMLGDPRLTKEEEVPAELSRLLLSLRFLRQLTAGEAESFMYRDREKAIGAVRASLWDQRMPPEATAMTLMTVCETLRSLDEIQKRREKKE